MIYNSFIMGQIIIDLPNRIKRHYRLDDKESADAILAKLERDAMPVKTKSARLTDEDKADIRAARRARKGDLVDWKDVKKQLGLVWQMAYKIQFEKSAVKQLSKLEKRIQIKIAAKIDDLADDPRPFGYKKLVDEGGTYRIKVSGYRVLYDVFDNVLIVNVISIAKRNERTY